jgi:hypothetical protein
LVLVRTFVGGDPGIGQINHHPSGAGVLCTLEARVYISGEEAMARCAPRRAHD